MISPEKHFEQVERACAQVQLAPETLPIVDAAGRVLAAEVRAPVDSPLFDNSQMDGFGLSAYALAQAPGEFAVGPMLAAGTDPAVLASTPADQVIPVMTGAQVPPHIKAIVKVEDCSPADFSAARVQVPAAPEGQFIRRAGSDVAAGQVLLHQGEVLSEAAVAALASQAISSVAVRRRTRILIVTGGAEIGEGPARIPDANGPLLRALAQRYGIEVVAHVRTSDDPAALVRDLEEAIAKHSPDAIVSSGGISHGTREVIRQLLPQGWFGHVAQQPGGPQGLGEFQDIPLIALPGNPVSTLVSFRLFVAPALGQAPEPISARLDQPRTGLPAKDQFLRARTQIREATVWATISGGPGSHLIAQASRANVLARIPADSALDASEIIQVYPL